METLQKSSLFNRDYKWLTWILALPLSKHLDALLMSSTLLVPSSVVHQSPNTTFRRPDPEVRCRASGWSPTACWPFLAPMPFPSSWRVRRSVLFTHKLAKSTPFQAKIFLLFQRLLFYGALRNIVRNRCKPDYASLRWARIFHLNRNPKQRENPFNLLVYLGSS